MGNKPPVMLPIAPHQEMYIGNSYKTLKTIYLQKGLLINNSLHKEPLDNSKLGEDKFKIFQYTVPPGSIIKNIKADQPLDKLGLGHFLPVHHLLNGTLCMDGKELQNVDIGEIIKNNETILEEI